MGYSNSLLSLYKIYLRCCFTECICLIQLIGAAALAVGIWVLVDGTILLQLLSNIPNSEAYAGLIQDAAYVFIAAGAGIFVLAFLGCCGAWKRNKCMLITVSIYIKKTRESSGFAIISFI